ncbi:MAG: L-threonylcarbamoyladenylate synthase [Bacteroidales bacterium]
MKSLIEAEIKKAIKVLENGGVILYPTDTIWGIGCDATNKQAVEKIFHIKRREKNKSMIVLMENIDQLKKYIVNVPMMAYDLIENANRPTTIIYPEAKNLPDNLIAADGSIAVRIPDHELCQLLIKTFGKPITSTSANFSGEISADCYENISTELLPQMDYIIQIMHTQIIKSTPSRILKLDKEGCYSVIRD